MDVASMDLVTVTIVFLVLLVVDIGICQSNEHFDSRFNRHNQTDETADDLWSWFPIFVIVLVVVAVLAAIIRCVWIFKPVCGAKNDDTDLIIEPEKDSKIANGDGESGH